MALIKQNPFNFNVISGDITVTATWREAPKAWIEISCTLNPGEQPGGVCTFNPQGSSPRGYLNRYDWNFGRGPNDIATSTNNTIQTITSEEDGQWTVTLTVTDVDGNTDTISTPWTLRSIQPEPSPQPTPPPTPEVSPPPTPPASPPPVPDSTPEPEPSSTPEPSPPPTPPPPPSPPPPPTPSSTPGPQWRSCIDLELKPGFNPEGEWRYVIDEGTGVPCWEPLFNLGFVPNIFSNGLLFEFQRGEKLPDPIEIEVSNPGYARSQKVTMSTNNELFFVYNKADGAGGATGGSQTLVVPPRELKTFVVSLRPERANDFADGSTFFELEVQSEEL